jgi:hypothetical protein
VTYKTSFGLDDWIYCTLYIHTTRDYRQYSTIIVVHTFQFTVTHALGFSVFISRILATDLSQTRCHFRSHLESSLHQLISFLALILRLQIPKTRLIQFICSQAHILPGWYLEARPLISDSTALSATLCSVASFTMSFCNPSARTTQKTHPFIFKEACLLVRYLSVDVLLLHTYVSRECVYGVVA